MPVFASERFLRLVGDEVGWLGGVDDRGSLRCILPYTVVHKGPFRLARFRVETLPVNGTLDVEEERQFLESAMVHLRTLGADMVIPASTNAIFRTFPAGADAAPYGTYVIDLSLPQETLWNNVQARNRSKITSAERHGITICEGIEYLDLAHRIIGATLARSKLRFMSPVAFSNYVTGLGDAVKLLVAFAGNEPQGCIVVPYSDYAAYYVYGGSAEKPHSGAMSLLHWEAMRRFRALGVQRYDFVGVRIDPERGSKQEGLKAFKERFGGSLVRGYLWKYRISSVKFAIYNLAMRFQRGGDIVDAERNKLAPG
ncbi:MAG: peptidoglycan bridge formation glycyltransferase FemA/FemB family protein [Burkholderiales bacterium]